MAINNGLPLGLLLRRARQKSGMSQADLARRAQVSQPLVSYYERSLGEPGGEALARIAGVLGIELDTAPAPRPAASAVEPVFDRSWLRDARRRLLSSLALTSLRIAHLDRPAVSGVSGDLAFAFETRSHVLFSVVDGVGRGDQAAIGALLGAS